MKTNLFSSFTILLSVIASLLACRQPLAIAPTPESQATPVSETQITVTASVSSTTSPAIKIMPRLLNYIEPDQPERMAFNAFLKSNTAVMGSGDTVELPQPKRVFFTLSLSWP